MRRAAVLLILLALAPSAWGQWGPTVIARNPIDPNARLPALAISKVLIETKVLACLAETRTTLTIGNPHTAPVEADLHFALPAGAVVNGYALDVNGQMVDGVAVDKEEGRRVFEDIVVRQRRDPGLIEHAGANEFNVRIFPVPAKGTRTVSIRYLHELPAGKEGAVLEFPLRFAQKLDEAAFRMEVIGSSAEPNVAAGGPWSLRFARHFTSGGLWPNRTVLPAPEYSAEARILDSPAVGDVKIVLPQPREGWVRNEKASDGQTYFLIQDCPRLPAPRSLPPARQVAVLWDASGSRGANDHEKEFEVLRRYFAAAADRTVEVELVVFRHVAEEPRRFTVEKGDASALLAELKNTVYDGGTRLACAPPPGSRLPDLYLLFSDGKNTFGPSREPEPNRPLYAFSSSDSPDEGALRRIAVWTGGEYFNLAKVSPATAAEAIGSVRSRMLKADNAYFARSGETYPRGPQGVTGPVLVTGKVTTSNSPDRTVLWYLDANGTSRPGVFTVSLDEVERGEMLRRYWAQKKLADLLARPSPPAGEIAALGREYSLVTPYTSLMVLETVDQYVQYHIIPPQTQPEMRSEYARRIQSSPPDDANMPFQKFIDLWQSRLSWANPSGSPSEATGGVSAQGAQKYIKPKVEKAPKDGRGSAGIFGGGVQSFGIFGSSSGGGPSSPMDDNRLPLPDRSSGPAGSPGRTGPLPLPSRSGGELPKRPQGQEWPGRPGGLARHVADANISCLQALVAAPADQWMGIYLATRARQGYSPTLFLESGDFLLRHGHRDDAVGVLSNLAEHYWDSSLLLRWQARYLVSLEMWDEAVALLEEVHGRDPEDPLACRELALALAGRAARAVRVKRKDLIQTPGSHLRETAEADYTRAIDLLYQQALLAQDPSDRLLFQTDLSGLIPQAKAAGISDPYVGPIPLLREPFSLDLRVVLTGEIMSGGAELAVQAPYAEEDFPAGRSLHSRSNCSCGAQEYVLRKAYAGLYKVQIRRWGEGGSRPEVVRVEVITDFGRPTEKRRSYTLLLPRKPGTYTITDVYF
jgi:hypothetical protein